MHYPYMFFPDVDVFIDLERLRDHKSGLTLHIRTLVTQIGVRFQELGSKLLIASNYFKYV